MSIPGESMTNPRSTIPVVVTCEHASHAVPEGAPYPGVSNDVLLDHVSWDPGALDLAAVIARELAAPLVAGTCSRLLVDLNRSPDNPAVIPAVSFGVPVPGNQNLSDAERSTRVRDFHAPYWNEVAARIDQAVAAHGRVLHVMIHSFTPFLDPERRRFDLGLLFDPDRPSEVQLAQLARMRLENAGCSVELNRPYSGAADGIPMPHRRKHADGVYTCLEVEANQGMMTGRWAERLGAAVCEVVREALGERAGCRAKTEHAGS